jgi:hypothetical protein
MDTLRERGRSDRVDRVTETVGIDENRRFTTSRVKANLDGIVGN